MNSEIKYQPLSYSADIVRMLVFLLIISVQTGCKKYIEVSVPATSTNAANVYTEDATAAAVLTGIYAQMSNSNTDLGSNGITSVSLYAALSADELTLYNINDTRFAPYYSNELTGLASSGIFWNNAYAMIFIANSAIEGLEKSTSLTASVKQQLMGEAMFIRAFYYFYLVNLYGDVPLVTSSNYKLNSQLARSSKEIIYQQIINDLKGAQGFLSDSYLQANVTTPYSAITAERIRPTKWAATALLARVYLYTSNWEDAEDQAAAVINHTTLYNLSTLESAFKKNSTETIWSLQPVRTGAQSNTGDGALFILPSTGPNNNPNSVYLSDYVISNFESGDQRKLTWVDSVIVSGQTYYYPYKYKIGAVNMATDEYIMVLRLAEQYLIRAEARAMQSNIEGAQSDLNLIRERAGLANTTAASKETLVDAIIHERTSELFTEWGHRWFDLKRTNNIDEVMLAAASQKGGTWDPYKSLYPIPESEIIRDPKLIQNTGY